MKLDFPYKQGDIVEIFEDYQQNLNSLGEVKLLKFENHGRTFILEEIMPETEQIVYSYQVWTVQKEGNNFKHKIRYIDTIGIANSEDDETDSDSKNLPKDSFLMINDKEIF